MKKVLLTIAIVGIFATLSGQQFQTKMSGNITDMTIFKQKVINSNKWVDAVCAPYGYVTVLKDDTLTINQSYDLDSICVMPRGVLIINAPLNLLIPVIAKGGAITAGNLDFIQLPLTTLIDEVIPDELFNVRSLNGILKVNVRTYGDLKIVDIMFGREIFVTEVQSEGYHEFSPRLNAGRSYAAVFTSGNLRLVKKFICM